MDSLAPSHVVLQVDVSLAALNCKQVRQLRRCWGGDFREARHEALGDGGVHTGFLALADFGRQAAYSPSVYRGKRSSRILDTVR